jgi:hypothetical protein
MTPCADRHPDPALKHSVSDFATIRPFLSTAKKQGWKIVDALTADPENLAKTLCRA